MNNKTLSLIIGLVLILGIGALVYYQTRDTDDMQPVDTGTGSSATTTTSGTGTTPTTTGDTSATSTSGSGTTAKTILKADVALHATAASCWSIIDGTVYDLTSWISQHPGGERAILSICGKDGTQAFRGQHDHAQRQESILAGFKIGTLAQ